MLTTRTAWFPLRSNIAYFETTGPSLDIEARVKQMAMLSDELLFEPGILDVTISDEGSFDSHIPLSQLRLSEEDIRKRRQAATAGEPVGFWIGPQSAPGEPAPPEAMHQIIGGKLARSFVAEYHLLAHESGLADQPWVHFGVPIPEREALAKGIRRDLERMDFAYKAQMPALSENRWLDDYLRKGLNIDIGRGAALGVPVMLDQLHAPILQWRAEHTEAEQRPEPIPGGEALHLWAPNFTKLGWKKIIKLHDHDAIGEFRQTMVEAESTVAGLPEGDRELALKDIGYQAALDSLRSKAAKWRDLGIDLALGSVIDLIPYGGLAYSAVTGGAKLHKDKTEWTAILLALNAGS